MCTLLQGDDVMIALRTVDLRNNFRRVSEIVSSGEIVLIARPHNENLVILTEKEYNELEKSRRNAEYLAKIEQGLQDIAEGKGISVSISDLEELEELTSEAAAEKMRSIQNAQGTKQ